MLENSNILTGGDVGRVREYANGCVLKVLFSFYTEGNGSPERLHCWLKVTQPGVDSNFLDS